MAQDYFFIKEWRPQLRVLAEKYIARVHQIAPELEVLFMGAAALELPGKNDIDLDILCKQQDLERYAKLLTPIFGQPKNTDTTKIIWNYKDDGVEIDCVLSDPTAPGSHVPIQKRMYQKLKTGPELRQKYSQLKYDCNGMPYDQYEAKKIAFFESALAD